MFVYYLYGKEKINMDNDVRYNIVVYLRNDLNANAVLQKSLYDITTTAKPRITRNNGGSIDIEFYDPIAKTWNLLMLDSNVQVSVTCHECTELDDRVHVDHDVHNKVHFMSSLRC